MHIAVEVRRNIITGELLMVGTSGLGHYLRAIEILPIA